jgi:WD40 repeat protein
MTLPFGLCRQLSHPTPYRSPQIHHLVGHQHKITCVRLFGGGKGCVTGSADRTLKVWDIRSTTYRLTTTLRHSSTSTCVDVASDGMSAISGHMDGGLRLWDLKTGERTGDISGTRCSLGGVGGFEQFAYSYPLLSLNQGFTKEASLPFISTPSTTLRS